jgi:predicted transcriptional regulator
MNKLTDLKVGTLDEFFEEGRRVARLVDAGRPIPESRSITFENLEDLLAFLTPKRIALFEAIKASTMPTSITAVAQQVGRDRAAVKRDIDALCQLGFVDIDEAPLPGHGRQKLVRPVARQVVLTATL